MNMTPCQRSHGLRFEPGTAATRAVFKPQGHADWTILVEFKKIIFDLTFIICLGIFAYC